MAAPGPLNHEELVAAMESVDKELSEMIFEEYELKQKTLARRNGTTLNLPPAPIQQVQPQSNQQQARAPTTTSTSASHHQSPPYDSRGYNPAPPITPSSYQPPSYQSILLPPQLLQQYEASRIPPQPSPNHYAAPNGYQPIPNPYQVPTSSAFPSSGYSNPYGPDPNRPRPDPFANPYATEQRLPTVQPLHRDPYSDFENAVSETERLRQFRLDEQLRQERERGSREAMERDRAAREAEFHRQQQHQQMLYMLEKEKRDAETRKRIIDTQERVQQLMPQQHLDQLAQSLGLKMPPTQSHPPQQAAVPPAQQLAHTEIGVIRDPRSGKISYAC